MTERTEALIQKLARGLQPVRRLPRLGLVASSVAGLALLLVAAQLVPAWWTRSPWLKPGVGINDAGTIAAHALLFAGALAFALGACVPGREPLQRNGIVGLVLAFSAIAWIGAARSSAWPGPDSLEAGWLGATFACSLHSILPAALPVLLLARFAARAAPRRAFVALLIGAAAPLGLLTQPGVLGCAYPDELHQLIGHLLTPALGAPLLLIVALPVFLILRPSERV